MQQTISINIVDPATLVVPDSPSVDESLPQLGTTITNVLTEYPLLYVIIGLVIVAVVIALCSKKTLGGNTFKSSALCMFALSLLVLTPLAYQSFSSANLSTYADTTATIPNQTVNIAYGETAATFSFAAAVNNTTYTDGYDLATLIDAGASDIPTGVSLTFGGSVINDTVDAVVREYRKSINPSDNGQIEYNITIPADEPIADGYATITLNYSADDFISPSSLLSIQTRMNNAAPGRLANMPQLTSKICAIAIYDTTNAGNNADNTIVLTDIRNSKLYRIRKLADDKCWMIDNLALGSYTVTSADSNVSSGAGDGFAIAGEVHDAATHGNGRCDNGGEATGYGTLTCQGTATAGANNTPFSAYSDNTVNDSRYGYLYNHYTATAGTVGFAQITLGEQATGDICPKGWHLPSGYGANEEFGKLDIAYGGSGITGTTGALAFWQPTGAWSALLSGEYATSGFNNQGVTSIWWTSTVRSGSNSQNAYADAYNVYPGTKYDSKYLGYAVRCVV